MAYSTFKTITQVLLDLALLHRHLNILRRDVCAQYENVKSKNKNITQ